ncbi:hypothetical protein SAMN02746026_03155 [Pseudomonas sp. LAIL14HWK12:I4]|jgi:hypothetical protein|nr:hypothetical protein [Pseudomonas cremoricolorata]TFA88210.1 hypothetical protein F473_03211 [Pseudomonas sp. URIL14HWK12:I1]SNB78627.1 hypothetical protein SAMN02746026_03155 [Pseudomonas sp. LAIL14HWK12:I4]
MARRFRLETDVQTRITKLTEVSYTQYEELLQANYKKADNTPREDNSRNFHINRGQRFSLSFER